MPSAPRRSAALADVAVNGYRISSAGVCSSEDRAALLGELREIRRYDLSIRDDLHVPELPDVKIQLPNIRPAHEDVGCSLNESLTGNNSLRGSRSRAARPAATRSARDAAVASTERSACCPIRYERSSSRPPVSPRDSDRRPTGSSTVRDSFNPVIGSGTSNCRSWRIGLATASAPFPSARPHARARSRAR